MSKASLAELEAVATVARCGGFRSAARELEVSSSSLSHAVAALEERMGVRLFNRTTRSVALSAAGEQFVAEIGPALAAIAGAMENAGEHRGEPSGTLRLNMSTDSARTLLAPLVFEYLRRYPKMQVEITTETALVDVMGQGFDAGVRIAEAVPPDMIAIPISAAIQSLVVGSPEYFKLRRKPRTPHDLLKHECVRVRFASGRIYHWEFERRGESLSLDLPGALTLDESSLIQEAALQGMALAYLPRHQVAGHLKAGRLVSVLEEWTPPYPGLCLYYSGRRHLPAKMRALIDLIREKAPLA